MNLIISIAWRNILRHRGKSIVIGVILFLGALLMTVGNGVIAGMDIGITRNIVNAFMGDIVLISNKQKTDNILFDMMGSEVEPISTYAAIKKILLAQGYVERFLPAGKNMAMILMEEESTPSVTYMMGVDFAQYRKMFPDNSVALEGRFLEPGEKGILIPTHVRDEHISLALNAWVIPEGGKVVKENMPKELRDNIENITVSSNIVLMGTANSMNSSSDVRFGIKGIIKYRALNTIFGHFSIVDIESYRECMGYFSASENAVDVPAEEKKLLEMDAAGLDSMFGSGSIVNERASGRPATADKTIEGVKKIKQADGDPEDGIYNMVFVRLKDGISYGEAVKRLNGALSEGNTGVKAVTWNKASGPIGSMTLIIKGALFVFVTLLFLVAIIIIVNTLTMSALERTPEIGMMRAVGARKSFIGGMFIGETAMLSAIFGGAGIVTGILTVKLIPLFKITTNNDMVQLLYGGDIFSPVLTAPDIALTVFQLALVTGIAAFYPVVVARGITPLDAIQRD